MTQRMIVQMGMGIGGTVALAAERAVADALARAQIHVDVPFTVRLTLGVPEAAQMDPSDLARAFSTPDLEVHVVAGGMQVPQPAGDALIVVGAAIERFPLSKPVID